MKPNLLPAAALAMATLALPAGAALAQLASPNPATVRGGTYSVEPIHTRILFAVNHLGFTIYYGNFTGASGSLTLSPKDGAASAVEVSVPVASVSTTNAKLDAQLRSDAWLDAAKFPTMTFDSTKVMKTGPSTADMTGDLTLHGVTKPITLSVRFNGAGVNPLDHKYTVGFNATGAIQRSDFGVTKYVPLIGDPVTLTISAAFEKQG